MSINTGMVAMKNDISELNEGNIITKGLVGMNEDVKTDSDNIV